MAEAPISASPASAPPRSSAGERAATSTATPEKAMAQAASERGCGSWRRSAASINGTSTVVSCTMKAPRAAVVWRIPKTCSVDPMKR